MSHGSRRPVVLVVCDGWGHRDEIFGNAIAQAATPHLDRLSAAGRCTTVAASGGAVGLPDGQQGNSEVGHLTIGSGRIILQSLTRISRAVADGSLAQNPVLIDAVERTLARGSTLHCIGLVSPGGVHSHQDHAAALVALAHQRGLARVAVHVLTDGRDEPPTSAAGYVEHFQEQLSAAGSGRIASVAGRYWGMDRDRRWERVRRYWDVLVGNGVDRAPRAGSEPLPEQVPDAVGYIRERHAAGVTDEFLEPMPVVPPGQERVSVADGDTVVMFNFRPDRARQLAQALVLDDFDGFDRGVRPRDLHVVTFTEYDRELPVAVAFPKEDVGDTLAEVVSRAGLRQYHVAETEKYAHVTYFLNGGREDAFPGEERQLVPSPKVSTYDLCPEMSAASVTDLVVAEVEGGRAALVVVNFANADMVGHTGDFAATVSAVETVDGCIGRIGDAVVARGGALVVTADHGNAEEKIDSRDNSPLTAHTTNEVPVVVCGCGSGALRRGGGLRDVAPTVLAVMGVAAPAAMTGRSLLPAGD